jgi:hypothetical protein
MAGEELLSLVLEQIQGRESVHQPQIGPPRQAQAPKKGKLP